MYVRPQDMKAIAVQRTSAYRPANPSRRLRRFASVWHRLTEAWNVRPRPRLSH